MSTTVVERDITCNDCAKIIDHHVENVEFKGHGQSQAMLMRDAVDAHREEDGCPCSGWTPGPYGEEHPL